MKVAVTRERALELLAYDPQTGALTWRVDIRSGKSLNSFSARTGEVAGHPMAKGYWRVGIDGRQYLAHILIWFMVTGEWPKYTIDHQDTNHGNNRWLNLRDVTKAFNSQNQVRAHRSNKSTGLLGVSFDKTTGKFRARIWVEGRNRNLGSFDDKQAAREAYLQGKRALHPGSVLC